VLPRGPGGQVPIFADLDHVLIDWLGLQLPLPIELNGGAGPNRLTAGFEGTV
jgi:hypothetical protein